MWAILAVSGKFSETLTGLVWSPTSAVCVYWGNLPLCSSILKSTEGREEWDSSWWLDTTKDGSPGTRRGSRFLPSSLCRQWPSYCPGGAALHLQDMPTVTKCTEQLWVPASWCASLPPVLTRCAESEDHCQYEHHQHACWHLTRYGVWVWVNARD